MKCQPTTYDSMIEKNKIFGMDVLGRNVFTLLATEYLKRQRKHIKVPFTFTDDPLKKVVCQKFQGTHTFYTNVI